MPGSPHLVSKAPLLSKYFGASRSDSSNLANATIDDNSDSTPVQTSRLSNRAHENLKQTTVLATGRISSPPLTTSPSTIQPVSHDYTITRGSQVSPLGMPRTLRRQPGHLAAKPDDPRHGARNNHGHSQSQDQRPNPLSPPKPYHPSPEAEQPESSSAPSTPAVHDEETKHTGNFRLQPVAYSPNPQEASDEDDCNSWREGDDMGKSQPLENEPKAVQGRRAQAPPKLKVAPQLPPLYFEWHKKNPKKAEPRVEQKDVAYTQQTQSASAPKNARTVEPNPRNLRQHSAPLGPHPSEREYTPPPPGPYTARPETRRRDSDTLATPDLENDRKRSFPNQEALGGEGGQTNSFYWHSPQSSTNTTEHSSPKVSEATLDKTLGENVSELSLKSATSATTGLTSATALGVGGPSDWEYFANEAEEVDDIDLYAPTKPKTAELSAGASSADALKSNALGILEQDADSKPGSKPDSKPDATSTVAKLPPIQESPTAEAPGRTLKKPNESTNTMNQAREVVPATSKLSTPPSQVTPPKPESPLAKNGHGEVRASVDSAETVIHLAPPLKPRNYLSEEDAASEDASVQRGPKQTGSIDSLARNKGQRSEGDAKDFKIDNQHAEETGFLSSEAEDSAHGNDNADPRQTFESPGRLDSAEGQDLAAQMGFTQSPSFISNMGFTQSPDVVGQMGFSQNQDFVSQMGFAQNSGSATQLKRSDTIFSSDGEEIVISFLPTSPFDATASRLPPAEGPREGADAIPTGLTATLDPDQPDPNQAGRKSIFPQSIEIDNPYANLDPWAKASLNRYVKMLRDEDQAGTDEAKYQTFVNFTHRETKLRAVLYDVVDEGELAEERASEDASKGTNDKALPALPEPPGGRKDASGTGAPAAQGYGYAMPATESNGIPFQTNDPAASREEAEESIKVAFSNLFKPQSWGPAKAPSDESFVMVDNPGGGQNPPGLVSRISTNHVSGPRLAPSLTSLRHAFALVANRAGSAMGRQSPSPDASAIGSEHDKASVSSHADSGPPESANDSPGQPAHDPSQYSEGQPYEGDKATNRQTIYRPYSMLLRQGSQRQGSLDTGLKQSKEPAEARRRGTVAGPSTDSSGQPLRNDAAVAEGQGSDGLAKVPPNYRYTILEPLLAVVPLTSVLKPESDKAIQLRQEMDSVPDDFRFIHATVVAWDGEAKHAREKNEKQRHLRQAENEQRIDSLFNENEIVYSDISELELVFKQSEAEIKGEEDRAEFESFVANVFDAVWARLHYEMDQLSPLYDVCTNLVSEASAGRDMFQDRDDRVPIAPAMELLLILYQKLHVRHQKAFEAVLERDRRLKKTELAPWYALGHMEQVKLIDKRFEDVEKRAILEFCRQRDERANCLMDVLNQHTLRGVGSNQDYMEAVMQAVRKIANDVARGTLEQDALVATDEILKAKAITNALARSSEHIVQTFHVADMILNAADYEVSVANAKLANAHQHSFRRLREAKAKEDSKLVKDLEHRMSLIRGDTNRTTEEIAKLLALIANLPGGAPPVPPLPRGGAAAGADERKGMGGEEGRRKGGKGEAAEGGTAMSGGVGRGEGGR